MYLYSEGDCDYHQIKGKTIRIDTNSNKEEEVEQVSQQQLSDSAELNKFNRGG